MPRRRLTLLSTLLVVCALAAADLHAQTTRPRLGVAFNAMLSSTEGLGVGMRGRAAWPVNADMSVALGAGLTGFVLEGRDEATYLVDPQASLVVTLDREGARTPYFLGGIGVALPINDRSTVESGPTLHFGIGWVQGLRDTVLFYEIDPTMLVGESEISFMVPFRVGVIF